MVNFEKDYKTWDEHPFTSVNRENVLSFIIWSFWDSHGQTILQYYRWLQLNQIALIEELCAKDLNKYFTPEELVFFAEVFNSLFYEGSDKDGEDDYHTETMIVSETSERLLKSLKSTLHQGKTGYSLNWETNMEERNIHFRIIKGLKKQ